MQPLNFQKYKLKKDGSLAKGNFKVVGYPETLFPPNWNALKETRCPKCSNKLYQTRKGNIWTCRSKKHKPFVITDKKLRGYGR